MPPAKAGATETAKISDNTRLGKSIFGDTVTGKQLLEIAQKRSAVESDVREYDRLTKEAERWRNTDKDKQDTKRMEWVDWRIGELQATVNEYNRIPDEAGSAVDMMVRKAARLRKDLATRGSRKDALEEAKANEEYFTAAYAIGGGTAQQEIKALWDDVKRISANPEDYLTNHEIRQLVRAKEGLGLKERGQGICFKMLDQYMTMSPKEKSQIAGVPNVVGCTAEGVRQWMARNADFAAEAARKAFEASQEVEKARQELQDLRLTCFPMPDWVRDRIESYPQKAVGLQLGMKAALPVPFTRDEVLRSVRDVLRYSSKGMSGETAGRCAAVDPTSVSIAKHVASVLAHWFSSWGWVRVQLVDGGRWSEFHLADRIDKLHNDPFTYGFSPKREPYVTPLELGASFTTTFDTEQRMAAAPAYLRLFGRPVFGPAAALAQELEAAGQLTPEAIAQIEEMIRSGVTWEQVQARAAPQSGESWVPEGGTSWSPGRPIALPGPGPMGRP